MRRWCVLVLPLAMVGCRCLGDSQSKAASHRESYAKGTPSDGETLAPIQPQAPLLGDWNHRTFEVLSALAYVSRDQLKLVLRNRKADCSDGDPKDPDMAAMWTITPGPRNDFFAGHDIAVPIRLTGAGIGTIPSGHTAVGIEAAVTEKGGVLRGRVLFRYRVGREPDAPSYSLDGVFSAQVCEWEPTSPWPAMSRLDEQQPVRGIIAGRERLFPTFIAFVRRTSEGASLLSLKGYTAKRVPCLSDGPSTPYMFGPEIGPGPNNDYFVGTPMPAEWILQLDTGEYSERSVHAAEGRSLVQLDAVQLGRGGTVRGRMMASTSEAPDAPMGFDLSGSFEASVCEAPGGEIAP